MASAQSRFQELLKELEDVYLAEIARLEKEKKVKEEVKEKKVENEKVKVKEEKVIDEKVIDEKVIDEKVVLLPSPRASPPVRAVAEPAEAVTAQASETESHVDDNKLKPPRAHAYGRKESSQSMSSKGFSVKSPTVILEEAELELDDPATKGRLGNIFMGERFEFIIACILLANLVLMAVQLQWHGYRVGHEIGYNRYVGDPEVTWRHAPGIFLAGDIFFAVIFTLEMVLRLVMIRCAYFRHVLNWIDLLVVCSSWLELFAAALPISPTFLRMLRLGKLLRALKVVRMSQVLESLQLLLKCIYASMRILFWSLVLLLLIQCSAGMTISYMLNDYMVDPSNAESRFEVFRYYGTFTKTLLTMFEVLFANWAPACRVLVDNVSEWYSLAFIVYRCFVGFAVLNVVNAVFIQSTLKLAHADEELIASEKAKVQNLYRNRVNHLFREADTSGDGFIDLKEFQRLLDHPQLHVWLHQLEIETQDLEGLFRMLDDGDGEISLEEFETGILKLKGVARNYDMNQVQRQVKRVNMKLDAIAWAAGIGARVKDRNIGSPSSVLSPNPVNMHQFLRRGTLSSDYM